MHFGKKSLVSELRAWGRTLRKQRMKRITAGRDSGVTPHAFHLFTLPSTQPPCREKTKQRSWDDIGERAVFRQCVTSQGKTGSNQ